MKRFIVLVALIGLVVYGCTAQKEVTRPPQSREMQPQQPQTESERPRKAPEKITEQEMAKVESREMPSNIQEISGIFKDIFFEYDKFDIKEDEKLTLKTIADYLRKNTSQKLLIEGHCDERGTTEYNLALGDKRARASKDYLVSLGASSSRVEIISYGKEKPACTEHAEGCWSKNRRDHFVILKGR